MLRSLVHLAVLMLAWPASAWAQAAASAAPPPPLAPWPAAVPGPILSTPDWSDYHLYPLAARKKNAEGAVIAEIRVGADGTPAECRIRESSGWADLDGGTCTLMLTMRFEPARDANGAATPSHFARRITWLLGDPRAFASSSIEVDVRIAGDKVVRCGPLWADGAYSYAWSTIACTYLRDRNYFFAAAPGDHRFVVAARLDAGDQSAFLTRPWPKGTIVAQEKLRFDINRNGDPIHCTPEQSAGFGPRGLNNLSPCGSLLAMLWFRGAFEKHGVMETRVYLVDGE